MVCPESRPLYKVIVPCALVASWCRFPVAATLALCINVSGGSCLPCTWIAARAVMERWIGIRVTVADGLSMGTRRETATIEKHTRIVSGISNQYGLRFGGV